MDEPTCDRVNSERMQGGKEKRPDKGEKYPGSEQDAGVKKHVQDVPMNDEKI
jgi:hypothetical protein